RYAASAAWKSAGAVSASVSAGAASTPAMSVLTASVARPIRVVMSSTLQYGADPHAAGRTDRDQTALRIGVTGEQPGKRRADPRAGGGEGVAERNAAALHVELGAIDAAERCRQSQHVATVIRRLPGLERTQHLCRERLVDLVVVEVLESDAGVAQHGGHGI